MKPLFFGTAFAAPLLGAVLFFTSSSQAQEMARYQLQPTPEGLVRLDTHTGELAYCREVAGALECTQAQSDAALLKRIEALEKRIAVLERQSPADDLPSDAELEKGFSIMEKFMRRFKGLAEEFNEQEKQPNHDTLPQKT
ncbi:hypothetical protein [Rhizobium sp. L1K21]|uniref:hypothetical protein n=1 Tax=Rhizobium sp. L1K21 TaxID=2954933 RepID=UPI002093B128|nr:hypothetical protein [Rhizobium sp. L1K21]MCO6187180.1 hypothetical protein [Rhizobium sp. L1K21]